MENNAFISLETRHSDKKNVDYNVLIISIDGRKIELFPGNKSAEIEYYLMIHEFSNERRKG